MLAPRLLSPSGIFILFISLTILELQVTTLLHMHLFSEVPRASQVNPILQSQPTGVGSQGLVMEDSTLASSIGPAAMEARFTYAATRVPDTYRRAHEYLNQVNIQLTRSDQSYKYSVLIASLRGYSHGSISEEKLDDCVKALFQEDSPQLVSSFHPWLFLTPGAVTYATTRANIQPIRPERSNLSHREHHRPSVQAPQEHLSPITEERFNYASLHDEATIPSEPSNGMPMEQTFEQALNGTRAATPSTYIVPHNTSIPLIPVVHLQRENPQVNSVPPPLSTTPGSATSERRASTGLYIHGICGSIFERKDAVLRHHNGQWGSAPHAHRGCWNRSGCPNIAWDSHPSCQIPASRANADAELSANTLSEKDL